MVAFWDDERKDARKVCLARIQFAEKHGNGKMAMEEKARLQKLDKIIQDRKNK